MCHYAKNHLFCFTARPAISLNAGPFHVLEGSNVTLPVCHVSGHPPPVVTWSKSFGQLPQERVRGNSSVIKLLSVRKADSDNYLCTATNLLGTVVKRTHIVVVSLPRFITKPPNKVVKHPNLRLTLNCSASGNPLPVISWRKQGAQLPSGRSQQTKGVLVIKNLRPGDAGNYICTATSAGVFNLEAVTYVEVQRSRGELLIITVHCAKTYVSRWV